MNSLTDYIHESYNNDYYNIVLEKLDNNERIIDEENLLLEHGKDIDNILYKFNSYVKQNLYNNINESNVSYKLTVSEQQAVRDLFIYVCEDYKRALEDECNIYEKLLSGDESLLNEDFKLADNIKTIWQAGKDKVNQAVENAKVSIKELNELIKQFASKTIKTVKDIAEKIIELIEKIKSSLFEIAKKIGFNDERIKKIQDELTEDLQNNTDKITKANVYESYSDDIKSVNEGIVDAVNNSKAVKWYKDKKQKPLWNAFFQFANWGIVCVILPGFIVAMFPGTQVALLLIMVIKIAWQLKKFKKLKKQISDAYHNWGTYTKTEKFYTALTLAIGIGCTIYNFVTLGADFSSLAAKITEDFWNEGISGLLKSNDLGMKPDNLTLAVASVFKMVKEGKFSLDISDAKKELIDAFTKQDIKVSTEKIKRVFSNDIKDLLIKKFEKYTGNSSTELVNIIKKTAKEAGFDISNVSEKANYTVYLDGQLKGSDWGKKVLALMKEMGVKEQIDNTFNKPLEAINSNAGSGSFVVLPGKLIKAALKQGIEFGANNHHAIVGETYAAISTITTKTVTSVAQALSMTAPVITLTPKHAGFIVRLGGEGTENYTYKVVKKNGIITGEYGKVLDEINKLNISSEYKNIIKDKYDKIKDFLIKSDKEGVKEMNKAASSADEDTKKEVKSSLEHFNNDFTDKIDNQIIVIMNGRRIDEKNIKAETSSNESKISSLNDYIINEKLGNLNNNNKQNDKEINNIIDKLFNDDKEGLKDEDKKKIIEYINKEFDTESDQLTDDAIQDIISKISELLNNLKDKESSEKKSENTEENKDNKDEESNSDKAEAENKEDNQTDVEEKSEVKKESLTDYIKYQLITEGVTVNNIYDSIIDDILDFFQKELEKNKKDKNIDKKYIQTISDKLDKIFNADKLGATTDSEHLGDIDSVVEYFVNLSKGNFSDFCKEISIKDFCKLFTYINSLYKYCKDNQDKLKDRQYTKNDKNLSKENNNDISDEAKLFYKKIVNILSKTKEFENYLRDYNKNTLNIKVNDDVKEPSDEEWMKAGGVNPDYIKITSKNASKKTSEETSSEETSKETNSLLSIYKKIISLFGKSDKVKKDIKDNVLKLIDDEDTKKDIYKELNIESKTNESLVNEAEEGSSLLQKLKNAMSDLKNYLLKKKGSDNNDDKSAEDGSNNSSNDNEGNDELTGEIVPVLMFANDYIVDLAPANKKGVRDDLFTVKGMNKDYEFFTVTGGFSIKEIQDLLGEYLHAMTSNLIEFVITKPNEIKKNWWKDKIIVNPNVDPNDEREEFGKLTNSEIVDILNNPKNASKYISAKTGKLTDNEKETIEKNTKENTEKLKNKINDDEVKDAIKEIDPEVVKDDGTVDDNKLKNISASLANWQLQNYYNNRKSKKKGLWARIKAFFGFGDDDNDKYSRLNGLIGESLSIYNDKTIGYKSLTDYLKENLN